MLPSLARREDSTRITGFGTIAHDRRTYGIREVFSASPDRDKPSELDNLWKIDGNDRLPGRQILIDLHRIRGKGQFIYNERQDADVKPM